VKKKLLLIHYNSDSKGSFVEKTLSQVRSFREKYSIVCMLPKKGNFSEKLEAEGVRVVYRTLHEKNNILKYLFNFLSFVTFLFKERISLVYYLDYVWWKPAEVLAVKCLKIPSMAFCGFYKSADELKGFISLVDKVVVNSQSMFDGFKEGSFAGNLSVIHNFIEPSAFEEAVSIRSEIASLDQQIIAFVGSLQLIKGIEYAIQAMSNIREKFPKAMLLIVGSDGWCVRVVLKIVLVF